MIQSFVRKLFSPALKIQPFNFSVSETYLILAMLGACLVQGRSAPRVENISKIHAAISAVGAVLAPPSFGCVRGLVQAVAVLAGGGSYAGLLNGPE
jgi:hypothetical protein